MLPIDTQTEWLWWGAWQGGWGAERAAMSCARGTGRAEGVSLQINGAQAVALRDEETGLVRGVAAYLSMPCASTKPEASPAAP